MLDQRRAEEFGYITLKEAAKLANYTPDYVGQLIRTGKIRGEQVYSNVAWVTTEDEVQAYLADKHRTVTNVDIPELVPVTWLSKYFLYTLISLCVLLLLFLQYVLYVSIDARVQADYSAHTSTTASRHVET